MKEVKGNAKGSAEKPCMTLAHGAISGKQAGKTKLSGGSAHGRSTKESVAILESL